MKDSSAGSVPGDHPGRDAPVELIGGREPRRIEIASYSPEWSGRFAQERDRIASALGPVAHRIDHIGSTAVEGLDAKPIIDIDVSVRDPEEESSFVPSLEMAGYALRVREPGHRMLRTPDLEVHVHVCARGSDWERRHVLFREWLRFDADDRRLYAEVKRELARREWADMNAYADVKSDIVRRIMDRAELWAQATDWTLP
jgi:GrpB-like predicted nucleotidyltransferase (UPF0157 family)